MKVYITGGTGLVGRNLTKYLTTTPSFSKNLTLFTPPHKTLDLMDYKSVYTYIKEINPDLVIHCAGYVGGIQANTKDKTHFFCNNAVMGINIVRASLEAGVKNLLNLSSSCTYPKDLGHALKESDMLTAPLEPTNEGYAIAKIAVEKFCHYITLEQEGFLYKTLVPCNLYGEFDKFGERNAHLIPSIIRKIHKAKVNNIGSVTIWGGGEARREFMFALDLAECIGCAINDFKALPSIMNVGLGYDYSVNEYYEIAKRVIGYEGGFTHDLSYPVGMEQKLLDITLQSKWGWKAKTSLEEGIKRTYEYYKESVLGEKIDN